MNRLSTNRKIEFLQEYVRRWHRKWHKKHPDNIVGFRIGKKKIGGIESKYYSIIFKVKKKKKKLDKDLIIPKSFSITFPDGKKRKINTDVEESGVFRFQSGITSAVTSLYSSGFGSAGLFVTDSTNRLYMLTNFHVVAGQMIQNGKYYYRRPNSQKQNDVRITLNSSNFLSGRFEEGIISHEVDAAFVELFLSPNNNMNILPDQNKVRGRVTVRPYPSSFIGKSIVVYSYYNKQGRQAIIKDNSLVFYTDNPDIYFEDLLQISPKITRGGDSGGLVLTTSFSILGLIVGADLDSTYVIPFYKVDDFKNIFIP